MITFVTWKWRGPDPRRAFTSHHVNVLRAMIARHYTEPHRLVCFTDEPKGLHPDIDAQPLPDTQLEHLLVPERAGKLARAYRKAPAQLRRHAPRGPVRLFPSCYRRLWLFSAGAALVGERLFLLDIDCVITGDLAPLMRHDADFVGWSDPRFGWNKIAGGAWLLRAGSRTDVWTEFDAARSPALCKSLGLQGSDQAWLSHKLFPPAAAWTQKDGVHKVNWLRKYVDKPPAGTRLVFTNGTSPPWAPATRQRYPWIAQHWHV
jgi:hypothetical protein